MIDLANIKVDDYIVFEGEKQKYKVQARNERYIICTKPFNLKKTVLYTIIDLKNLIRGTDNLVFGMGYETKEDCINNLNLLEEGEIEISGRNYISLNVNKIIKNTNDRNYSIMNNYNKILILLEDTLSMKLETEKDLRIICDNNPDNKSHCLELNNTKAQIKLLIHLLSEIKNNE